MKTSKNQIENITTENKIEESIKEDILASFLFPETRNFILQITEDMDDSPEDYDYNIDDFNQFIFKHQLTS